MNILMITTWYTSKGSEKLMEGIFHYEQSMALKKYANVCLYHPLDTSVPLGKVTCEEEWGLLTYRSGVSKNRISKRKLIYTTMNRIMKEFEPDIIHTHVALGVSKYAIAYGKLHKIPVMVSEHVPIEMMNFEKKKNKWIAGYVYKNSKFNGCCSNQERDDLRSIYPKLKFETIYNGIVPMTGNKLNCNFAIPNRINMCIVAGFYDQYIKGYQYLLPAIKQVSRNNPNIMLHVVGGGTYLEYYQNVAKELDIEEYCHFYGNCTRDKVYSIVDQMDFGISASIMEASGVSIQEQMFMGLPVLVTKSGGCNSLVTSDTAIVVDKESTDALAQGILLMIDRYNQFDKIKIQEYANENFNMENVTQKYVNLYERLIKNECD